MKLTDTLYLTCKHLQDQFAGMSSARLSVDMGDMGTLAFDQGSGSGLATIDDKTPTAAEEIWDGLDGYYCRWFSWCSWKFRCI